MELKRVVVTGIGALTPLGNNLTDFGTIYWQAFLVPIQLPISMLLNLEPSLLAK
jgi:hypothetical protein